MLYREAVQAVTPLAWNPSPGRKHEGLRAMQDPLLYRGGYCRTALAERRFVWFFVVIFCFPSSSRDHRHRPLSPTVCTFILAAQKAEHWHCSTI